MAQRDRRRRPFAEFIKMPQAKYTFRYSSEKRPHGTMKMKIRVNDYEGPVKAVLACVSEKDLSPHPNKVMCPMKHRCPDAVCIQIQKNITEKNNEIVFSQIGILRVKKEELEEAMRIRTSDTDFPFARGYDGEGKDLRAINLTRLRFACQVLILDAAGALTNPLEVVVTTPVTHYTDTLKIIDASHDCGAATGGLRVFLFTAPLPNSVDVVFRGRDSDWRAQAGAVKQHKKVALQFTTPPYENPYCSGPVKVYYFMTQTMDTDEEQLPDADNRREFTYSPITDKTVLEDKIKQKNVTPTLMNNVNGVRAGGDANDPDEDAGAAAAAQAPYQHEVDLIRIPSGVIDGGAVPHQNPAEHYIPEPCDNSPLPTEIVDFVNEFEAQAMDVDSTARHNLERTLFIERWLLEQLMEVDVAGYTDLPG